MNWRYAVLCLALIAAGCDRNSGSGDPVAMATAPDAAAALKSFSDGAFDRSHDGEPLPAYVFSDPNGKRIELTSLKGQPVLINLWATWCGPCVAEMPTLDKLATDNARTVRVITLAQDATTPPVVAFFKTYRFSRLEPWLDPEGRMDIHYGTGNLPTTVYYDSHGREVWRYVGARDWTSEQTTALLLEGTMR